MLDFAKGGLKGEITVKPARIGENVVSVMLHKQDGSAADFRSVRVFLSNSALGIDKLELKGAATRPGEWRAENAVLPVAGEWTIAVEVRISDFEQVRSSAALAIGG
jgi:copper transport protein